MINQTYSDGEYIYSVYLMFLYVNDPNIRSRKIRITTKLLHQLRQPSWGDPKRGIYYSAMDVIKEPTKYPEEIKRIHQADLRYPIMIDSRIDEKHNYNVVDGIHRLSKAYLNKKKHIRAYIFSAKTMKKFQLIKLNKPEAWKYVDQLTKNDLEKLFRQRFSTHSN